MIDVLFAFAIQVAGYTDWCTNVANGTCTPPAVVMVAPSPFVHQARAGWYRNGTAYVKERDQAIAIQVTQVHEFTHHLQRLSGRYHGYRGICNQWRAEKEAYEAGAAWALKNGYKVNYEMALAPYEQKCRAAVAAGLVKDPGL